MKQSACNKEIHNSSFAVLKDIESTAFHAHDAYNAQRIQEEEIVRFVALLPLQCCVDLQAIQHERAQPCKGSQPAADAAAQAPLECKCQWRPQHSALAPFSLKFLCNLSLELCTRAPIAAIMPVFMIIS
jgi:hypothetical protein